MTENEDNTTIQCINLKAFKLFSNNENTLTQNREASKLKMEKAGTGFLSYVK